MEIKIRTVGLPLKSLHEFENFQGNLKNLNTVQLRKLKESIRRNGFNAPIFLWAGKNYILDGHQRILAIQELIAEGWDLPNKSLPYVEIIADNEKQAAEQVLSYNSQYGKLTEEGTLEFKERFDLDLDELQEFIEIREITHLANLEEHTGEKVDKIGTLMITCPKCGAEFSKKDAKDGSK